MRLKFQLYGSNAQITASERCLALRSRRDDNGRHNAEASQSKDTNYVIICWKFILCSESLVPMTIVNKAQKWSSPALSAQNSFTDNTGIHTDECLAAIGALGTQDKVLLQTEEIKRKYLKS